MAESGSRQIRGTHPYMFRSGQWARLAGTMDDPETGRRSYAVEFPDGAADWWPVADKDAGYEFRDGDGLEEAMRRSGLMAKIEESRAHPERMVPFDLDQFAEEGQMDGGVVLCVVCGDEASGQCASCDRDLCEAHLRTTAVPGDSFCLPGEGCSPKPFE